MRKISLRYKIITLTVLAVSIPALLLSFVLTSIAGKNIKEVIFRQQSEAAKRVADRISSQVQGHRQLLKVAAEVKDLKKNQSKVIGEVLAQGPSFYEITVVSNKGIQTACYTRNTETGKLRIGKNKLPQRIAPSTLQYARGVGYIGQNPFITLSAPMSDKSGVLSAKMYLNDVWKWIAEVKIGKSGRAFVVDKKGLLLAHPDTERVLAKSDFSGLPVVQAFIKGEEPSQSYWNAYNDERGNKVLAVYEVLPELNWAVVIQTPYDEIYNPLRAMYTTVAIWVFVFIGIFVYLALKFVNRIINPLAALNAGVKKIAQGALDVRFGIETGDEVQELAENFEKMASVLKELEEVRTDLINMIIHDLKNPLSGIMGGLDLLGSGLAGEFSDEQKQILGIAKRSSEKMLSMIQNLLDVSKMEEGMLKTHTERVELSHFINDIKTQFESLCSAEGKIIRLNCSNGVYAQIDKSLIERVLGNLISNAIFHTLSGGNILISVFLLDGFIEVSVCDDGPGVPQEYKDKIFEKFVQINRKQAHLRTGTGLGLTFCKLAVELHGGTIKVESQNGSGSAFIFTLPICAKP